MKSCAKRQLILPRRSSTAGSGHDRVYRRSSGGLRGRADLQGSADRPSTYHVYIARRAVPSRLTGRVRRDADLKIEIRRVFEENFRVYGVRKVWRKLRREGFDVARCTRLMRDIGLRGAIRGKPMRTTISDNAAPCPLDHVNRHFRAPAPDRLWLADFTYVATWIGFVYVAFVIDACARRIVGWPAEILPT
jgi:putative transposase